MCGNRLTCARALVLREDLNLQLVLLGANVVHTMAVYRAMPESEKSVFRTRIMSQFDCKTSDADETVVVVHGKYVRIYPLHARRARCPIPRKRQLFDVCDN